MEPIRTTSGKTLHKNLEELRRRRPAAPKDALAETIAALDGLCTEAYAAARAMREHSNRLRLCVVQAKQLVLALRKGKVDVEL